MQWVQLAFCFGPLKLFSLVLFWILVLRDSRETGGFIHARAWQCSTSRPVALLHHVLRNSCCFTGQLMSRPFPYTFVLFAKNTMVPFNSHALLEGGVPCTRLIVVADSVGWANRTTQGVLWWSKAQGWIKEEGNYPPWLLFFPSFTLLHCFDPLLLAQFDAKSHLFCCFFFFFPQCFEGHFQFPSSKSPGSTQCDNCSSCNGGSSALSLQIYLSLLENLQTDLQLWRGRAAISSLLFQQLFS